MAAAAAMSSVSLSSSSSMTSPRRRRTLVQETAIAGAGFVSTQQVGVDENVGVNVDTVIVMALKKNLGWPSWFRGAKESGKWHDAMAIILSRVILKIILIISCSVIFRECAGHCTCLVTSSTRIVPCLWLYASFIG